MSKIPQKLIVIARGQAHPRASLTQLNKSSEYLAEDGPPVPSLPQPPAVNDVAHQVEIFRLNGFEECQQWFGLRGATSEMDIAQKDAAEPRRSMALFHDALILPCDELRLRIGRNCSPAMQPALVISILESRVE